MPLTDLCGIHGFSKTDFHKWKAKYGGMEASDLRWMRELEEENRSLLLDAPTIEALERVVNVRMRYYNEVRWHSALGNQPPCKRLECRLNDVDKEQLL